MNITCSNMKTLDGKVEYHIEVMDDLKELPTIQIPASHIKANTVLTQSQTNTKKKAKTSSIITSSRKKK